MDNKISVLFIIDHLKAAGTQRNLLEIVRGLDRNLFDVHVIALRGGGVLEDDYKNANVQLTTLNIKRAYGLSALRALHFLKTYMSTHNIKIVQNFFLQADILGTIAAKWSKVPTILSSRRDEGFWRTSRQLKLNKCLNRWVDSIVVNSEAVRSAVLRDEQVNLAKIEKIYNGIDPNGFYADNDERVRMRQMLEIDDQQITIGTIANMNYPVKGYDSLIYAVRSVIKDVPNALFLFVGDGSLRSDYERRVHELGLQNHVRFLGVRSDILQLINAMDIYCHPALSEGFSNAILEAMACQKPIVATRVGGNLEMVKDGQSGQLVSVDNSDELAYAIINLCRQPELRDRFGVEARARVIDLFSYAKMIEEYENLFKRLAKISGSNISLANPDAKQIVMS